MEDGWDSDDSSSGSEGLGAHGGAGGAVADSGAVGAAGGAGGPAEASDMWFDEVPTPRDLEFPCEVSELAFHPHQDVVAVGLVSGRIELYTYSVEANKRVLAINYHKRMCRGAQFSPDGETLYTCASDKSVRAVDKSGTVVWEQLDAHGAACNALLCPSEALLCSGDEDGAVKVWDLRTHEAVFAFDENEDFISDFAVNDAVDTLLATSGDGTLSVFDLRRGKLAARSDPLDDELLSVEVIKGGKKVLCGTQDGILCVYSWGLWGDLTDRFPGHPQSVDALLKIDEDTVATGSSDGVIRLVSIQPDKLLAILGDHEDYPIEKLRFSRDHRVMGSASHDQTVKFWDTSFLVDGAGEEPPADEAADEAVGAGGAGAEAAVGGVGADGGAAGAGFDAALGDDAISAAGGGAGSRTLRGAPPADALGSAAAARHASDKAKFYGDL